MVLVNFCPVQTFVVSRPPTELQTLSQKSRVRLTPVPGERVFHFIEILIYCDFIEVTLVAEDQVIK